MRTDPKENGTVLRNGLVPPGSTDYLAVDQIHHGDARQLLSQVQPESVALSFWSPPYFVGKSYEKDLSFDDWKALLVEVVAHHPRLLRAGGFLRRQPTDLRRQPPDRHRQKKPVEAPLPILRRSAWSQ